jgi:hypothetical protein
MKHLALLSSLVALLVLGVCLTAPPPRAAAESVASFTGLIDLSIRPQRVLTTPTVLTFTPTPTAILSATGTATATETGTATPVDTATATASATATVANTPTATATASPVCDPPAWHLTSLPITGTLRSIAAITDDDVWAAGDGVLHWDGQHWQSVAPAIPSGVAPADMHFGYLTVGGAASIWMSGWNTDHTAVVIEHWNGTAWTILPAPAIPEYLYTAVSATGPNDAYALVSGPLSASGGVGLVHCTTTACTTLAPRYCPSYCSYTWMAVISATDIWITGTDFHSGGLLAHWDGTSISGGAGSFSVIVGRAANDVWAMTGASALAHWNGTSWSAAPAPAGLTLAGLAVAENASRDLWAFGNGAARWDGSAWVPVPGQHAAQITDLSPLSPDDAWAIGTDANALPVAEHYGTIETFGDVPASDTFYPYIEWMACRAIIGGYPCAGGECDDYNRPVFRPANGVSRGQMLKMVALAAGWPLLNPASASFADVAPGSTFYQAIETGYNHGIIGGYACGGVGEPCDAQQRPYFPPGAAVSRGQLSKILALARGYTLPTPPSGTFADVPPGSTFYAYVEAVEAQGIVGGYPCGGAGEPCDSGNHPYFRPTTGATRAQVSKMVTRAYGGP